MRSIWVLMLASATISAAQKYRVGDNPACAIPCIMAASKVASCSVIDESCVCPSHEFQEVVEGCTLGSCTFKDALATKNITWTACGYPNNDEYPKTIPARVTLFVLLPTLSFVLRMVVKKAGLSVWGADDTTIVVAYVFILGMTASDYIWASFGAGRNLWTLPERNVTKTFQMLFACQIQYFITLTAIRASILFMYLRIFPSRTFRIVLWATHAFNALVWTAFLLIIVFRCIPVNLSWTFWNGGGSDHCLPIDKLGTVQGVVFIALDVWLLILPATQVWRLNMKKSRKFGVTLMFGMGIFTTAIGIVRLKSISEATKYPLNPT
ncbi:CFEM domain-containing protein, partial [Colletotrichum sojae]